MQSVEKMLFVLSLVSLSLSASTAMAQAPPKFIVCSSVSSEDPTCVDGTSACAPGKTCDLSGQGCVCR